METLEGELETSRADIQEKHGRVEKCKADIEAARYDDRMRELNEKARSLENKRDAFTQEITMLSMQADYRAKLSLHQSSVTAKEREISKL